MLIKRSAYGCIYVALWLMGGCIDSVDLEIPEDTFASHLVVDGRIHDGPGPYIIELERTDGLGLSKTSPVTQAEVWILDGDGNEEQGLEIEPGVYIIEGLQIRGKVGQSYTLELVIDGERYRSNSETLPSPVDVSSIRFDQELVELANSSNGFRSSFVVNVFVDVPISRRETGPFIRWETEETYTTNDQRGDELIICYFTQPVHPQRIQLFNGEGFTSDQLTDWKLMEREIDWTFELRHVLTVHQLSITEEAFQYWTRVDQVINQNGDIFDPPPGVLQGNVSHATRPEEIVLGYFSAVSSQTARVTTFASDFSFGSVPPRCPFNPSGVRAPSCEVCWLQDNVSFDRPDYFN